MSTSIIRLAARPKLTTRTHLEIGSQIFHNGTPVELLYRVDHDRQLNGTPVELLYRVDHDRQHETWRVRPLFIEAPDRNEQFRPSDRISFLHTIRTHCWSRAA